MRLRLRLAAKRGRLERGALLRCIACGEGGRPRVCQTLRGAVGRRLRRRLRGGGLAGGSGARVCGALPETLAGTLISGLGRRLVAVLQRKRGQ